MDPYRILMILFGLGMVIFVHELGHFLVARWAGVLVERFSIGFGPVLFSIKRGDTEYALSAVPFGGYVKMLGQTDTPEVEEESDDSRSYQNQNVFKRMAIISAGVVMNVIFGFVCFAIAFRMGVQEPTAVIGAALPGRPAWEAGLRAGDEIVQINGETDVTYETLMNETMLTRPGKESIELLIRRDGQTLPPIVLEPFQDRMKPVIGVVQAQGLELYEKEPTSSLSPASRATPPIPSGGRVVAVNSQPVSSHAEYADMMYQFRAEPVTISIAHKEGGAETTVDATVEPNYIRTLKGVQMKIGGIVAIQADSPAANAVDEEGNPSPIQPNDIIKAVDGNEDFDPMRLPDIITEKAGEDVTLTLLRPGTKQDTVKVVVTPRPIPVWIDMPNWLDFSSSLPASIPSIGIAYAVEAKVRKVDPESASGLQVNDRVRKARFEFEIAGKKRDETIDVQEDHWPVIFWAMQFPFIKSTLTVERDGKPVEVAMEPQADETWPLHHRGLNFLNDYRIRKEQTFAGTVSAGFERTKTSVTRLYMFLRSLVITRSISPQTLAGPIRIVELGYAVAEDLVVFLLFIGMLNINLAVINFLPIPILDGGHMVFLIYEMVMRRKPSEWVIAIGNWLGLMFIGLLMLFVIFQDLFHLFGS